MRLKMLPIGMALAGLIGALLARPSFAADYCIQGAGSNPILVGKRFKLPRKDKCKPFVGYGGYLSALATYPITGSACTSGDGTAVTFVVTGFLEGGGGRAVETYHLRLVTPFTTGTLHMHRVTSSPVDVIDQSDSSATTGPCTFPTPIP